MLRAAFLFLNVAIERTDIEKFLSLSKDHLVIDVRSPGEYKHAHIPGAYSLPLFSDEERKIVGTAYKQESREKAIKIGLDFFGPKMKKMIEEVEGILAEKKSSKTLLIYCWRGGMRSAGVAWLMDLYGFKVYTLAGGYKKFRNLALEIFTRPFLFNVIGGFTGSGKTVLLHALKEKHQDVIDLEDLAIHKGSAFGNIGLAKQPTQEMFENMLAIELRKFSGDEAVWIEDESQRIGDINLPQELWKKLRASHIYFLDVPFDERLQHIVKEYGVLDKERLVNSIIRIQKRLGGLETKNAINHLLENNTIECFRILLKYYDKWYFKSLHNRENINSLLHTVACKKPGVDNLNILIQQAVLT
jgi:tRNA 2-selenouridine synthase